MGAISFSIPQSLVLSLVEKQKVKNFIETGTYKGNSSIWAAKHFEKVYTIELNEDLFNEASSRKDAPSNITFIQGNSKDELPKIIEKLEGQSIFWLDGHWCMGAGGKDDECPLIKELLDISKTKDSIILIDDARCFLGPLPPPHNASDWPRIDEIFKLINEHFPCYTTTIIEDVIVAVPESVKPNLDNYWQNNFNDMYGLKNVLKKYSKISILKNILTSY